MSDDEFGKYSRKLIGNVAIGAAGVAGSFLAGPGGGVAAGAVVMTALEWLHASANTADGRVFEARFAALVDQVERLDVEVQKVRAEVGAAGRRADRQDFLSQEAVYSEFARSVADARTPEKRAALVNAAARQFDPRLGSAAARSFWFERVRELSDIEVQAIMLIAKHGRVALAEEALVVQFDERSGGVLSVSPIPDVGTHEIVAIESAAMRMSNQGADQPLTRAAYPIRTAGNKEARALPVFWLTPTGRSLAAFVAA